jgi:hypothetical protein
LYLNLDGSDNFADAVWNNGFDDARKAANSLGRLKQEGSCWVGDAAKICIEPQIYIGGRTGQVSGTHIFKESLLDASCNLTIRALMGNISTVYRGDCIVATQEDGSFVFKVDRKTEYGIFGYVDITGKNRANGAWSNGLEPWGARQSLGVLSKSGSCWRNEVADICVTRK